MRLPRTIRLGIGAIAVAAIGFVAGRVWLQARKYLIVNIPVNLSCGRIMTGKFEINLRASYPILIVTNGGSSLSCYENSILRTRRLTSVGGHLVDRLAPDVAPPGEDVTFGPYLGTLEGAPGDYSLEIEVLGNASCLNVGHPRLVIEATSWDYQQTRERYDLAFLAFLITGTLGIILVVIGVVAARRSPRACEDPLGIL